MRVSFLIQSALVLLFALRPLCAEPPDWSTFRGDCGRSGYYPTREGVKPGRTVWERPHDFGGDLVVLRGGVLVPEGENREDLDRHVDSLAVLDPSKGLEIDSLRARYECTSTPTSMDGLIFFPAEIGFPDRSELLNRHVARSRLVALNVSDRSEAWTARISASFRAPPAAFGSMVFVVGVEGFMAALDARTGVATWLSDFGALEHAEDPFLAAPLIDTKHGLVLFVRADAGVFALECATGTKRWARLPEAPNGVERFGSGDRCSVAGGRLYVACELLVAGRVVVQFDLIAAGTGVREFRRTIENPEGYGRPESLRSLCVAHGAVFVVTDGLGVQALRGSDLEIAWRRPDLRPAEGSPIVVGNILVVPVSFGGQSHGLVGLDVKTGEQVWVYSCADMEPQSVVAAGDLLYITMRAIGQPGRLRAVLLE